MLVPGFGRVNVFANDCSRARLRLLRSVILTLSREFELNPEKETKAIVPSIARTPMTTMSSTSVKACFLMFLYIIESLLS